MCGLKYKDDIDIEDDLIEVEQGELFNYANGTMVYAHESRSGFDSGWYVKQDDKLLGDLEKNKEDYYFLNDSYEDSDYERVYFYIEKDKYIDTDNNNIESSKVELRLYNHKTDDVFYKRLTSRELMEIMKILNIDGFEE